MSSCCTKTINKNRNAPLPPTYRGGGGGLIGVFSRFYNPIEKITFPPTTSDYGKCKIYSIDTFLKITIHSIHSIHYIVENIDIVRVLEVHSSGDRC